MIRITMSRDRDGEHFDQGSRQETPMEALRVLVQAELAYGGEITEASGTRLVVVARVLACVDTTIFEGTAAEMTALNQTAYYYLAACQEHDTVMEGVLADLARLPNNAGGNPLIISMAAPMLMGRNRLAYASMRALGITDEHDVAAGMLLGLGDFFSALELMEENPGMSLADVSQAVSPAMAA
ncbi:MAG: hypothetical protein KC777_23065 [Cyanobacteria bacterium HKST-UBA02]|nr:hypothetical protein [Cyanobacteria bacterium HKST-UBA02]